MDGITVCILTGHNNIFNMLLAVPHYRTHTWANHECCFCVALLSCTSCSLLVYLQEFKGQSIQSSIKLIYLFTFRSWHPCWHFFKLTSLSYTKFKIHMVCRARQVNCYVFLFQQEAIERQNKLQEEQQAMAESLKNMQKKLNEEKSILLCNIFK